MSITTSLSSIGLEEALASPTLKKKYLYKCLTNKEILTTEVDEEKETNGNDKLKNWEKFSLKEPIQRDLVEALLDAGEKYLFMLTPRYEPVLAAIRMSQPEHLVKVNVRNTDTLKDDQLEWLISGGNVKSLDIHGCVSLEKGSLDAINKFGSKLEYLRLGNSSRILPAPAAFNENDTLGIIKTPKLKAFILSDIKCESSLGSYWRFLLKDFISNLEDLQISSSDLHNLDFLEPAKNKLSSLTLSNCVVSKNVDAWAPLFKLDKLRVLDLIGSSIGEAFSDGNAQSVVQRLRTCLPYLTELNIDPGLVRKLGAFAFVKLQSRPNPKRLDFLGTMADVDEIEKGGLLANQVAGFGSTDGELRAFEYYADRLNSGYLNSSLGKLLEPFTAEEGTTFAAVAGFFRLFMKALKNNGIHIMKPEECIDMLHELLTVSDDPVKLGDVMVNQFVDVVGVVLRSFPPRPHCCEIEDEEESDYAAHDVARHTMCMMLKLRRELCLDHYDAVMPTLMRMVATAPFESLETYIDGVCKTAQLLETTVERCPELYSKPCHIKSIFAVITQLQELMAVSKDVKFDDDLRDSLRSMISSFGKICLTSGACRAAFNAADGVEMMIHVMSDMSDGLFGVSECESESILEILKPVLEDTTLAEFSKTIASQLEEFFIKIYSKWQGWENCKETWPWWQPRQDSFHDMMQSTVSLLSYVESDPRFGYEGPAASTKEIIAKLK